MAQVKVFYEPEMELLTVFWQSPRPNQLCTELGDGVILITTQGRASPICSRPWMGFKLTRITSLRRSCTLYLLV
jgi:hypothetical protein